MGIVSLGNQSGEVVGLALSYWFFNCLHQGLGESTGGGLTHPRRGVAPIRETEADRDQWQTLQPIWCHPPGGSAAAEPTPSAMAACHLASASLTEILPTEPQRARVPEAGEISCLGMPQCCLPASVHRRPVNKTASLGGHRGKFLYHCPPIFCSSFWASLLRTCWATHPLLTLLSLAGLKILYLYCYQVRQIK
jgi:hypothetical protein